MKERRKRAAPLPVIGVKADYDAGMSYEQMAVKYGVPIETIRQFVYRHKFEKRFVVGAVWKQVFKKERFGVRTENNRDYILDAVMKGVSPERAAMSMGIRPLELKMWRREDMHFDTLLDAARAHYLAEAEKSIGLAVREGNPQLALQLLEKLKDTKDDYGGKQQQTAPTISFNFGWSRDNEDVVDVTPELPLLEGKE
jgi:uncharacterized protein YjcR